jgi:hypothetical protein
MSLQLEQDSDQLLGTAAAPANENRQLRWWRQEDGFPSTSTNNMFTNHNKRGKVVSVCMLVLTLTAILLSVVSLAVAVAKTAGPAGAAVERQQQGSTAAAAWPQIRRIAFSSCTSYDLRQQPIWTQVSALHNVITGCQAVSVSLCLTFIFRS